MYYKIYWGSGIMTAYAIMTAIFNVSFCYVNYIKLSALKISSTKFVVLGLSYITLFSVIRLFMFNIPEPYREVIFILLSSLFLKIIFKVRFDIVFINMSVAFAVSYVLFIISAAITVFFMMLLFKIEAIDLRVALLSGAFESILIYFVNKIKIKFSIIQTKGLGGVALGLSGLAVILYSLLRESGISVNRIWTIFLGIALCATGILYWLKRESAITFNDKVKEIHIRKAKEENEFLDRALKFAESRLHDENEFLGAYQKALEDIIKSSGDGGNVAKAVELLEDIKHSRKEKALEYSEELIETKVFPQTGMILFDALIAHMAEEAAAENIDFDFITKGEMPEADPAVRKRLETLAANFIKNAVSAVGYGENAHKIIVVSLQFLGGIYELSVKDNGIPFEPEILAHLGERRITTHPEDGGTGIGFMTAFDMARSCGASVIITENSTYKTVAVRFDGNGEYILNTHRSEQTKIPVLR